MFASLSERCVFVCVCVCLYFLSSPLSSTQGTVKKLCMLPVDGIDYKKSSN